MLDAGFLELMIVFVVALLVIGPERMPEAVRAVMSVMRTVQRSLHNARLEIEKQVGADDIRRQLHNEEIMRSLRESKEAIENAVKENTGNVREPVAQLESDVQQLLHHIETPTAESASAPAAAPEKAVTPENSNATATNKANPHD